MASLALRRGVGDVAPLATPAVGRGKVGAAPVLPALAPVVPPLRLSKGRGAPEGVKDLKQLPLCAQSGSHMSMGERRLMNVGALSIDTQKAASRSGLTVSSRQGRQLDVQISVGETPSRCEAVAEPCSPASSQRSTALPSEPPSPSQSEVSIEDWGYDIGEMLGWGSIGTVRRVRRRSDGNEFACKHIRANDEEQINGLRIEYELLSNLKHSNIIWPHAFYKCRHNAWMCMEWCKGGSVESCVENNGAFSEPKGSKLARQLLAGIDYLHCKRVVHRDVKPDNLLLREEDLAELKICDFGSACRVGGAAGKGLAMLSARGSQLYAAPELRFGGQWNERVDVWAAGLCVFFLLRAELPFDPASHKSSKRLREGRLPEVAWRGMSSEIEDLVRQCLVVEMRDRPSAMELVRHPAMERLKVEDLDAEASPSSAGARMSPRSAAIARLWRSRAVRAAGGIAASHESPF